ncbi:MauE/DoxX family redox-associated membrane protein [Streptomyces sp. NRRL S-37]|uniref:MauE/DoxX family redox-associated membrane protein n=1 Tax=Streptomyces sp. NRRL S-37 TaxID=1463903 RepID=UPI0006909C3C|nr:MauE/DoxX family redox-associated membrane protein [Streptomyces sp. NRRL S-37]
MSFLLIFCKLSLVVMFVCSSVTKLRDMDSLSRHIETTARLPLLSPRFLARTVVVAEVAAALGLVLTERFGFLAAAGVLAGFTAYLVHVLRSGRSISCGCTGASGADVSGIHLVRNGIALVLALAGLVVPHVPLQGHLVEYAVMTGPSLIAGGALLYLAELRDLLSLGSADLGVRG